MKRPNEKTVTSKQIRTNLEFEIPSWDQIYTLLLCLAEKIQKSGFKPDVIIGVSRGGWIPARIMSDILENPKLTNVTTEFYIGITKTKNEPTITQQVSLPVKDKKILVVDDLVDTGKSLKLLTEYLQNIGAAEIKIATIYCKPWSVTFPHYYEKMTRYWVIFPWERKEMIKKTIEQANKEGTLLDAKEKLIISGLDKKLVDYFIKAIIEEIT